MYMVQYINFGYGLDGFENLEAALAHARRVSFEANIYDDKNRLVATVSPIHGVKYVEVDNA